MADYKILFKGSNYCKNHSLECFGMSGNLCLAIYPDNKKTPVWITLDKSTAIKLSKEIKRQIFLLEVWLWAKDKGYYSNFIEAILM